MKTRYVVWLVGTLAAVIGVITLSGCTIARPFAGPGYDSATKTVTLDTDDQVLVVVTHGILDRDQRGPFDKSISKVADDLVNYPGLIGSSMRMELFGDEVWTLSVWKDEPSFRAFVRGKAHKEAVDVGSQAIEYFEYAAEWVAVADIPISWDGALALLSTEIEE